MNDRIDAITKDELKNNEINKNKDFSDLFSYILPEPDKEINNRYKLEKEIGRGGFGVVFMGFDRVLKKNIALKFLSPKVTENERKFLRVRREVNLSQKITDERVVKIFSLEQYETDKGKLHFIVMEFLEGETLSDIIKEKGKYTWDEFKPIFFEILKGIKALHKKGIIHRDLKPSNIMVKNGGIKILDFGLSKEMDDQEKTSSIGEIVGSPQYMSPEQITDPDIDFRSDIYQLGIILYRVLSGVLPFKSESNTMDMILKRISEEPKKLNDEGIQVPKFLEFGLSRALEREPKNRFSSIEEMEKYFKKEHYPILGRTFRLIKKKPLLYFLIVIFILLSIFLNLKFSNIFTAIGEIDYNDDTIEIYSNAGNKLYKKKFENEKIVYAKKHYLDNINIGSRNSFKGQSCAVVFTAPFEKDFFGSKQSFKEPSNKIYLHFIIRDNNKYQLAKHALWGFRNNSQLYFDFADSYSLTSFSTKDMDGDGHKEIIFYLRHNLLMFPTIQFILTKGNNLFFLFNPGIFRHIGFQQTGSKIDMLHSGFNNLICHLKYIAVSKYNTPLYDKSGIYYPKSINGDTISPSLSQSRNINFDGLYILLPRTSRMSDNKWFAKKGSIKFRVSGDGYKIIEVFKDNRVVLFTSGKKTVFKDSREDLNKVYSLIDLYYKEKMISRDYNKALEYLFKANEIDIKNPWLKSSLLYFIGDMKIRGEDFESGENYLRESIKTDNKNLDTFQRICELKFLQGDLDGTLELIAGAKKDMTAFWGLWGAGKSLFKIYLFIHSGNIIKAEDLIQIISNKNSFPQLKNILNSILYIFKGDYKKAEDILNNVRGKKPMPYTLIEFRLFFSRAVILNSIFNKENTNKELLDLARFYIRDISINSISSDHLAKISRAYFLAIDGRKTEAEKMAKEGFEEILRMSKGDFFTRFWLFYDAYIYGKTMEILGDKKEAMKGYKECRNASPHTDLAGRAAKKVEI